MSDTVLLLVQLLVVLGVARLAGFLGQRLGQPRVIGEMVAGILLGPSLLGWLRPGWMHVLFPEGKMAPLMSLSNLGVILFMFVVGLHLDGDLLRRRAASAVAVSQASIVLPFLLGIAIAPWLHPQLAGEGVKLVPFALFLGAAMSVTAFPVLARILTEKKMLGTPVGSITIAAAAVDDVSAWCLLAVVVAVARGAGAGGRLLFMVVPACAYVMGMLLLVRPVLRLWQRRRQRRREAAIAAGREAESEGRAAAGAEAIGASVLLALGSALATEMLGVHALFGAFLAGAIVPREDGLARDLAGRLEGMVATVLLPLFFASTGLRTQIGLLHGSLWLVCAGIVAAAVLGKVGGAAAAARFTGMPWRASLAVGVLMNTRGLMGLVILSVGLEIGVLSPALFVMMVVMALVTTIMASPLLVLLTPRPAGEGLPARPGAVALTSSGPPVSSAE
ncbi:MAG TPA: cation:proton antiporter [Candidatus Polarisedimenticolia bacterium]|jgi:Kef-type K+ transport system membrane component KefB|nr:cation:proton antiporter [Candidatus Polarisedimenticolia bacterium]